MTVVKKQAGVDVAKAIGTDADYDQKWGYG